MDRVKIDDPVNCVATHAGSGIWGMIAVAFFVEQDDLEGFTRANGIFKGGSWRLLGVQLCAVVVTGTWGVVTTLVQLYVIEKTIGIRLNMEEELLGCDFVEHGIGEDDRASDSQNTNMKDIEITSVERKTASEDNLPDENRVPNHVWTNSFNSTSTFNESEDIEKLLLQEIEDLSPKMPRMRTLQRRNTADKCVQVYSTKKE